MNPSIFIATPMFGGRATAHYVNSMLLLQQHCNQQGIALTWNFVTTESLITRGRNSLAAAFLHSGCTHCVSVDADIEFQALDVLKMVNSGLDFVCGLYPMKHIDWQHVQNRVRSGAAPEDIGHDTSPSVCNLLSPLVPNSTMAEITRCGTGFMSVTRRVYDTIAPHVRQYQGNRPGELGQMFHEFYATAIDPTHNVLLSEDYYFCDLWRGLGGKIYAMLDINLRHVGDYVYTNTTKYLMDHQHTQHQPNFSNCHLMDQSEIRGDTTNNAYEEN